MFTAAFLMITKRVNNPNVQQMKNGDTKCGWYIHSMEYYLARRRNEVLIYVTPWTKIGCHVKEASHKRPHTA